jgi:alkaline phosphatase D
MNKIFLVFILIFPGSLLSAQDFLLPCRPSVLPQMAPFYHGVASGDPLSDRVIIWTRVTPPFDDTYVPQTTDIDSIDSLGLVVMQDTSIVVNWQVATDTIFANVVQQGSFTTDTSLDFTVKVDVTGLQSNTWYYYRFNTGGVYSITGRTRTLPVGNADSLRFAVFSCSDFQAGFFNAYNHLSKRNDLDAVIHVGDYYYEYGNYGSSSSVDTSRRAALNHDAVSLEDYRLWQSQYKLDPDLRALFQQYPWIQVWDDHDVANNGWHDGAENHHPATEGSWYARKAAAFKAYFEWLPVREQSPGNDSIIYRNFKWGNLLNLIMLDTRFAGRDSSFGNIFPVGDANLNNPNRNMLGPVQLAWVKNQLSDTSVQWRIMGNQVMIAPLYLFGNVLNGDQWDGYPAERKRVFDYIMQQNIHDVVFVTGDIHSSWAADLPHPDSTYNATTHSGSVATELLGTSITSTATGLNTVQALIQSSDPYYRYIETTLRGYLLFDVNKQRAQGDFIHIRNDANTSYTVSDDAQWMNLDGDRFLTQAPAPLGPRSGNPPLAQVPTGISEAPADKIVIFTVYPNPADKEISLQYYLSTPVKVELRIYDITGRVIYNRSEQQTQAGLYSGKINLENLAMGTYMLSISDGNKAYTKKFVKVR